jgi:nitroreductase
VDIFEAISRRHSYRGPFQETHVPREDLERIVRAGLQAPSGKNAQTTTFVIVDDPQIVKQVAQAFEANKAMEQARALIACVVDRNPQKTYEGISFEVEDCAAAVENMLLAITALGYASVWIDGWLRVDDRADAIGTMLGIPEDKLLRVILPIGVPAEEWHQKEKKPFNQRAWFNKYGM